VTALVALVAVTAVWGVTFVPVKDAVAVYPLFAFMTVRFTVASATLAVPALRRVRRLERSGLRAGAVLGVLLAAGYALQTAGLQRTDVSSTGFITGLYVVLTPLFALAFFRSRTSVAVWLGVALSIAGLALLAGVHAAGTAGDLLVLASTAAQALQIVFAERYAARYDALGLTFVEMIVALACFAVVALALGDVKAPHGRQVWFAIVVTGVFASALAYLVQLWAQRRMSAARIALLFALESPFAGLFGYLLDGDRLGVAGWAGCASIMAGIAVSEPAAAGVLSRLVRRPA
jgi:drug/metabolite transporter (DMT)-like permease